jgi:large subunit ribosomal protein L1
MKKGKKYISAKKRITSPTADLDKAMASVGSLSTSKFKGKIEAHISLNLNEKERKQPIRGSVIYSKPVGKIKKVLVFADPANQDVAKKAGADFYGLDDLVTKIKDGWTDFDVAIATPSVMPKIAVLGRILGTKGLMPNPKSGTVSDDIETVVTSYKGGKIDFKTDETGVVHSIIGTVETSPEELRENLMKLVTSVVKNSGKPERLVLKSIHVSPTMGPSVKINLETVIEKEDNN